MTKFTVYAVVAAIAWVLLRQFHVADWLAGLVLLVLVARLWFVRRHPGLRRHLYRKKKAT